jgi:hypothetical protein
MLLRIHPPKDPENPIDNFTDAIASVKLSIACSLKFPVLRPVPQIMLPVVGIFLGPDFHHIRAGPLDFGKGGGGIRFAVG